MQTVKTYIQAPQRQRLDQEQQRVEFIHGKILENGTIKYKVKWENKSLKESTFVPQENLENYKYNIRGFEYNMSRLIFNVALLNNAKKRLSLPYDNSKNVDSNKIPSNRALEQQSNQIQPIQPQLNLPQLPQSVKLLQLQQPISTQVPPNPTQQNLNLQSHQSPPQQQPNQQKSGSNNLTSQTQSNTQARNNSSGTSHIPSQVQPSNALPLQHRPLPDQSLGKAKPLPLQFRDPILDNELTEKQIGVRAINDDSLKYGNFNNGDVPLRIVKHAPYTRIQKALGKGHTLHLPSSIYFKIEYRARPSGTVPQTSYVSFEEIRDKYPRELLNYYFQNAILLDPSQPQNSSNSTNK